VIVIDVLLPQLDTGGVFTVVHNAFDIHFCVALIIGSVAIVCSFFELDALYLYSATVPLVVYHRYLSRVLDGCRIYFVSSYRLRRRRFEAFTSDAKIIRQIRRRVTRFITAYQSS